MVDLLFFFLSDNLHTQPQVLIPDNRLVIRWSLSLLMVADSNPGISKVGQAMGRVLDQHTKLSAKLKVHKAVVLPSLLYCCRYVIRTASIFPHASLSLHSWH